MKNPIPQWIDKMKQDPLFQKRILFTFFGVMLMGVGVGFFSYSMLGVDPFQVFARGTATLFPLSFGTYYTLLNLVLLVIMFFMNRQKIGLGTILNMLFLGYISQYTEALLRLLLPSPSLLIRSLALAVGILIVCFSMSLYIAADLGVSTYDVMAITIDERTRIPFRFARIGTDLICVGVGYLLGGTVGVGTLISAFFMGPIISFFREKCADPWLNRPQGK